MTAHSPAPTAETVLVTGASSGIGLELARLFAADGARLLLCARRTDRLDALASRLLEEGAAEAVVLPADLGTPDGVQNIVARLDAAGEDVDVLVNAAGFGAQGDFRSIPLERQLEMLQVNIVALTELSRRLLPGMIARGRGGIINVASTAAFQPGPGMAVYYATKAYVLSLTEALHEELGDTGVAATCLCPGPTTTEFAEAAGMSDSRIFRMSAMDAAAVARTGHRAFRRGRAVAIAGMPNRLGTLAVRLAPRAIVRKATRWLNAGSGEAG